MASMTLVLVSNNLGIMWVGIETTTLVTAFLICTHATQRSLEAMWKYLLMCTVGMAVAFMGTILVAASASSSGLLGTDMLLWSRLMDSVMRLNPVLLKAGFIFAVVGFGTKAGLAPMHNWLPDAHSQAPAPVSAMFSGFMLSAAMYCIMRYIPLVESVTGCQGWGRSIVLVLGLLSILVAAVFVVAQRDVKRLLAYSSVEHIGVIALCVGMGGFGFFAGLLHTLNHSLCKTLSFFSAGRLGQFYGGHDMRGMTSIMKRSRLWGGGLTVGILALIGVAPFSVFFSELMAIKAAMDAKLYFAAVIFLAGLAVVFIGALRYLVWMAWEPPKDNTAKHEQSSLLDLLIVVSLVAAVLILGLWLPARLSRAIQLAAQVLGGGR